MLRLADADVQALLAHAREGAPEEVCGILAGRHLDGGDAEVVHVFHTRNAHERPVGEYLIDPEEQLRVLLHVEDDLGLDVVGFYHSHPVGPAHPSTTDAARATWPDVSYVIVHLAPEEGVTSWRLHPKRRRFLEEDLDVVAAAPFVVDALKEVVHRRATATAQCGLADLPAASRQDVASELKAGMVLKTRHYAPCPHCWGG